MRIRNIISQNFAFKKIYKKQQCQQIIMSSISQIQKAAEVTLGPYGRTVLIQSQMQAPRITKDGITIVKSIQFENKMQDSIAKLVKKSVDGTNKYAGDGTTTSTVLIGEIMRLSYRSLASGTSSRQIRKGFEIGREICIQFLQSSARKVSKKQELMNVAMISTNGKQQISKLVVDSIFNSTSVRVQKSQKSESTLQYHSGIKISRGLLSLDFAKKGQKEVIYNYPLVVVSFQPLKTIKSVVRSLQLAKKARKQLIIFAPDFSDSVQSTLIYNNSKNIVECCLVSIPEFGDKSISYLKNIASMTSSYSFGQFSSQKIEQIQYNHFGKAVKITSNQYDTKIDVISKDNKNVQAIINVGGPNETVLLQNYDHMVDALNSTKSAMKDGIIAGGGVTFWRLSELLQNYTGEGEAGIKILSKALKIPRIKLMQWVPSEKNPLSGTEWQGYDLKKQQIVDMFEAGIVDSVNVAKSTIIDSLSLCTVLVEVDIGLAETDKNVSRITLKQLNDRFSL